MAKSPAELEGMTETLTEQYAQSHAHMIATPVYFGSYMAMHVAAGVNPTEAADAALVKKGMVASAGVAGGKPVRFI